MVCHVCGGILYQYTVRGIHRDDVHLHCEQKGAQNDLLCLQRTNPTTKRILPNTVVE